VQGLDLSDEVFVITGAYSGLGDILSIWSILRFVFAGFSEGQQIVSPEQGARTQTLCAIMPEDELVNGAYYADYAVSEEAVCAKNTDDAKKLYDYCDEVTQPFQEQQGARRSHS